MAEKTPTGGNAAEDRQATRDISAAELRERRAAARRTAWILAAVVLVIFTTFFLTGVMGRAT
jgi:hypothetical protein